MRSPGPIYPDREEAGTPNLLGAVAFEAAACTLQRDRLVTHRRPREQSCSLDALAELAELPGAARPRPHRRRCDHVEGWRDPLHVDGLDHGLVAAVLGYEHGIGVRSGCFCAQPYVAHLLGVEGAAAASWVDRARRGTSAAPPAWCASASDCPTDSPTSTA